MTRHKSFVFKLHLFVLTSQFSIKMNPLYVNFRPPELKLVVLDDYSRDLDSPTLVVEVSERIAPLTALTTNLVRTYTSIDPNFFYDKRHNPVRFLTDPSEGVSNEGCDNKNSDYILKVNERIVSPEGTEYTVIDELGKGTFGQVVECRQSRGKHIALKVIKNKPAYFTQGLMEVKILQILNTKVDPTNHRHIVRMLDYFVFKNHLVIIYELLNYTLLDLIYQNGMKGFTLPVICDFAAQILVCLKALNQGKLIHCDLKPENIMLKQKDNHDFELKVIDFGSSCFETGTIYHYIQSRHYRAPEILMGLPYSSEIDTWSFACICVEMFIGLPVFPGVCEYDMLDQIFRVLGPPTSEMWMSCSKRGKYFKEDGAFKSREEFAKENPDLKAPKQHRFEFATLEELVLEKIPYKENTEEEIKSEQDRRRVFLDFLRGMFQIDPSRRWNAAQCLEHPFISKKPYEIPFVPQLYNLVRETPVIRTEPATNLRSGSCPEVLRRLSNLSVGSTRSNGSDSYRPDLDSMPEDMFKNFMHGRLPQYSEQQKPKAEVIMSNIKPKSQSFTPWQDPSNRGFKPPPPQRIGPRNMRRPHSFTHAVPPYPEYFANAPFHEPVLPHQPASGSRDKNFRRNRRGGSGGYKPKRSAPTQKIRSNSFSNSDAPQETPQPPQPRKVSFNQFEENKRASPLCADGSTLPRFDSQMLDASLLTQTAYHPVTPRVSGAQGSTGKKFLDKVADQAKRDT